MKVVNVLFCSMIVIFGCSSNLKPKESSLLESSSEFIMEDGDESTGYYMNREKFITPYKSYTLLGTDTLLVSTLHQVNACEERGGDVLFKGDTLFLETKSVSGNPCASVIFKKYSYKIFKKGISKFYVKY